jgi:hypothetical protein
MEDLAMNNAKLVKEITNAVEYMKKTKFDGTYYWILDTDENGNDWAIVLGWSDGYEPNANDDCMDGTYSLCAKIAYQSSKSIMQCDYDLDWTTPYNEETGETDETEIALFTGCDMEWVVNWLLDCYESYNN